ncbi:MAG: McrB family protein [Treponema sp.]
MNKEMEQFKHLLEYFVAHLEWCVNENTNGRGYKEYLKIWTDNPSFKKAGQGYKGGKIQNQIKEWENYNNGKICIAVDARNYQATTSYLHWYSTWFNIRSEWNGNHINGLYLTSQKSAYASADMEKSLSELELFNNDYSNFSKDFKEFFNKFMSYKNLPQGASSMTNEKLTEYKELLLENHNLILHGAPGTGKTHLAKEIAEAMNAEVGFCQFHPSYDYTDFVEGLRPISSDESGQICFKRMDGVFKEFCANAVKNVIESKKSIEEIKLEKSVEEKIKSFLLDSVENEKEYELVGKKTRFIIKNIDEKKIYIEAANKVSKDVDVKISDLIAVMSANKDFSQANEIAKFLNHPNYGFQSDSYVFALYKELKANNNSQELEFDNVKIEKKNFVFIIDEINRGELSKIFGELFFSIDPGYRGLDENGTPKGLVATQYQNLVEDTDPFKKGFFVPDNVYIIGTMNDIDRSVESMDFAMRRRFIFKEVTADESAENMNLSDEAKETMKRINDQISQTEGLGSAYHIGGAYFRDVTDFEKLWELKLSSLVKEYLRGLDDENKSKFKSIENAYFNQNQDDFVQGN